MADAWRFADANHAEFPSRMLAYNLSPSFNWDTTGMSDEKMRRFPENLGMRGFAFNFITYGGHQIAGLAAEEFAAALKQDGMLSLARLQRKSPWSNRPTGRPRRSRRAAVGRSSHGLAGRRGGHQSDGQGLNAASAPVSRSQKQTRRRP